MFTATLNGKVISANDVYNVHKVKIFDVIDQYKKASQNKEITCKDCGMPLVFNCGDIKRPYFSHWKGTYDLSLHDTSLEESDEHLEGVFLLEKYFKSIGKMHVDLDKKLAFNRRANLYLSHDIQTYAVEFIYRLDRYKDWIKKNQDYIENKQKVLWIISNETFDKIQFKDFKHRELAFEHYTADSMVYLLDTKSMNLHIRKYMSYSHQGQVYKYDSFEKVYNLFDLNFFIETGFDLEDFKDAYSKALKIFEAAVEKDLKPLKHNMDQFEQTIKSNNNRIEYELKTGVIKKESHVLECLICGKKTSEFRKKLDETTCICTCLENRDALIIEKTARKRHTKPNVERYCLVCHQINPVFKLILGHQGICDCLTDKTLSRIKKQIK